MKIYFTASARGKKLYGDNYKKIYELIEKLGHKNLDDLILKIDPREFYLGDQKDRLELHKNTLSFIKKTDLVILEVSIPSLSMGYVANRALEDGKPVILLHLEQIEPFFAQGAQDERLQVLPYTPETIKQTLEFAINIAKEQVDLRFTILLPPKIVSYLNDLSKKRKIPRAVFIRNLIKEKMREK